MLLSSLLSTRVLAAGEEVPAPAVVCVAVWERIGIAHGMRRRRCVSEGRCQVGPRQLALSSYAPPAQAWFSRWADVVPCGPHRPRRLRSQAGTPPHRPRAACSASRRCFAPSGFQARGSVQGDLALLLRSRAWTRWWWLPSARRHTRLQNLHGLITPGRTRCGSGLCFASVASVMKELTLLQMFGLAHHQS